MLVSIRLPRLILGECKENYCLFYAAIQGLMKIKAKKSDQALFWFVKDYTVRCELFVELHVW
jgi:hypothetical protein